MTIQTTTRIIGSDPYFRHVAIPVTPRERMHDEEIGDVPSPLFALTDYCDAHGWRIHRYTRDERDSASLHATIRPSGKSTERLAVDVTPTSILVVPIRTNRGMRRTHGYQIAIINDR